MADLFGCVGVSFEIIDKKTQTPVFIELGKRIDIEISQEYLSYYGAISPRVASSGDLPVGDIGYDHRILNEAEMDADEFYSDLLAPLGLRYFVSGHILNSDSHTAVIAAQRSPAQGHFGESDFALMKRMMPVVQQAMDLRFRLKGQEGQTATFLEGLEALGEAALLIDPSGRVRHMNAVATALFADNAGAGVANGALHFSDTAANDKLDSALKGLSAAAGEAVDMAARNFVARRPNKDRPLLVSVRSIGVQGAMAAYRQFTAIVLIRDPAVFARLDTALLMRSYALSAAEAEIAQAFDLGLTLQDIAQRRSVALSTVRSQFYNLMAKLSVSSQTELARLLRQYRRAF
ncbi:MAG: hypothetical protein GKS00_25720 [Alphaproteobacteria bacterium]|nr:hypothetical protein [Alphaproteobacteria bacterium]